MWPHPLYPILVAIFTHSFRKYILTIYYILENFLCAVYLPSGSSNPPMQRNTESQITAQNVKRHKEAWTRLCESTVKGPSLPEENAEASQRGKHMWTVIEGRLNICHMDEKGHSELKLGNLGLPWWRSGWESACQCRGHRFEPWSGRIPHAAEQLGLWATTTEPARLEPVLRNKRGRDSERPAPCNEEWPTLAATGESPRTETKTQHSQKIN